MARFAQSPEKRGPKGAAQSHGAARSRKELISDLLSKIERQLGQMKTKVTLSDFIRLIQLQRELEKEEQPAEVIVTWRDAPETSNIG